METWRKIVGYDGEYEVSNLGNARSWKSGRAKLLTKNRDRGGYFRVKLSENNKSKYVSLHRLVAATFIGNIEGYEINHIDGDKENNTVDNLEIVTGKENKKHAKEMGLNKGYKRPVEMLDKNTLEVIKTFDRVKDAADFIGVSESGIIRTCKGKYKHSGGYGWRYKGNEHG